MEDHVHGRPVTTPPLNHELSDADPGPILKFLVFLAVTVVVVATMVVFFYNLPSGLVLYWTMTNLGTWLQQAWVNRTDGSKTTSNGEIDPTPPPSARSRTDAGDEDLPVKVGGNGGQRRQRKAASLPKPRGKA